MKKLKSVLLTVCVISLLFISCDNLLGSSNPLLGTWAIYRTEGNSKIAYMKIVFGDDTVLSEQGYVGEDPSIYTGTYTYSEDKLFLTSDYQISLIMPYEIIGDKLIAEYKEGDSIDVLTFTKEN